ncbi:uncharacterized protein N7515_006204 [Penicillium bovifimosum]|uniref:Uncharacterized protein n=1 Tax=Penicillium bovifimosum TaxID=126998 RepID=A0A9W9GU69_9EURO|nr:uncharacterized protein N7515_006204 [Penicillium bovifimosum]KAJ5130165.1 hypothetical protein N7515_006204 [Penicillium bovifimosum]
MSQAPRGNDESSATSSKNQTSYQSINSGLIPRDYLARSDQPRSGPAGGSRQITPSPLQTSFLPQSYRVDSPASTQSPLSPRSSNNTPPSQTSPITRVANATFPAPPSSIGHSLSQTPETAEPESMNVDARPGESNMSRTNRAPEPDRSATSSVSSVHSMPDRPPHRVMPRTSSIDSAISSLSSNSQRSAFDVNSLSPNDINNLINAAGSAEAVIMHLLKEKHQSASQNTQLWKLVDKQRTLILGLNKDLERALQEKEKYKKKLKELQDAPPVPAAASRSDKETGSQKDDQPSIIPSPETSRRGFEDTTSPVSATDIPSPIGDGKSRLPHPGRKPPPAPLTLRQPQAQADANKRTSSDSGSDYGDTQEANETPGMDRGRRKTREQDDKDREAALQKDGLESTGSVGATQAANSHSSRDTAMSSPETVPGELSTRSPPNVGDSGSLGSLLGSRPPPASSFNGRSIATMPMSPGLPLSPRPEDRPMGSPMPRMPRDFSGSMAAGYQPPNLPSSPRMANQPMGFAPIPSNGRPSGPLPSIDPSVMIDSPRSAHFTDNRIYQGLMSDEYPGLLLPPNALPLVQVRVSSSRLRPSRNSYMASKPLDEEPVFTLSVISRSEMSELWRVEKIIGSLPQLDQKVRQSSAFPVKLPDRNIFNGHSPAKVDLRRAALNAYFDGLLDTPMDEKAALAICQFLTNDAIEPRDDETSLLKGHAQAKPDMPRGPDGKPQKEGYLTKRGKNFGGWKARYFVLTGPELRYYESPGGAHMGTIKLHRAQIGKQSPKSADQGASSSGVEDDSDNQYRHAFLILEPKKKDSSALVRHVLCAESDEERDTWVDALMEYVESASSENEGRGSVSSKGQPQSQDESQLQQKPPQSATEAKSKFNNGTKKSGRGVDSPEQDSVSSVQGFSFDDAVQADPPTIGSTLEQAPRSPRLPAAMSTEFRELAMSSPEQGLQSPRMISRPTNGAVIQDVEAWGNKAKTSTKEKKRSIWGFRTRSSFDLAAQAQTSETSTATNVERTGPVRPVFGIPLAEAVQDCAPPGIDVELPAVVYRCIEYLHAKEAALEEGIFRLSGSNVVIKALKERFNTEGDVDFVSGDQYYDIHAVASLFKQYLRELPTTVLTRELHLDFLRVLELDDRQKKVLAFNSLVHRLPRPNLALLRALSQFLIEIVNNSDVNKMTVRNVGIVFAPTLNIPAPVFSMFLTDYDSIFGDTDSNYAKPGTELTVENTLSPDDIRSPRHQMFSDIPTPSYQQTSFRNTDMNGPSEGTGNHYDTGFIPMQPSYDQPTSSRHEQYNQPPGPGASAPYSSLNGMLVPGSEDTRSAKTKRRESSMLFMDDPSFYQGK